MPDYTFVQCANCLHVLRSTQEECPVCGNPPPAPAALSRPVAQLAVSRKPDTDGSLSIAGAVAHGCSVHLRWMQRYRKRHPEANDDQIRNELMRLLIARTKSDALARAAEAVNKARRQQRREART